MTAGSIIALLPVGLMIPFIFLILAGHLRSRSAERHVWRRNDWYKALGVETERIYNDVKRTATEPTDPEEGPTMTEWLDAQLAAEEHRQGLALGGDPDHCGRCSTAHADRIRAERIANCRHEETVTDVMLCGPETRICVGCGKDMTEGDA